MKYRAEIDGLRAVAVISVLIYHAEIILNQSQLFAGGFIGVDIFFVISGYLITSILLKDITQNKFNIHSFYERRARRILPALFFVIITFLPFAYAYMLPKALISFSKSLISSLFFVSNLFFWLEDSYTAVASAFKPFLHTWSLSIEEQFYIFFPPILVLIYKKWQRYTLYIFACTLLSSLIFTHLYALDHQSASFFLLPSRVWELLAGSILAQLELKKSRTSSKALNNTMPTIGLFLIGQAIIFFDDKMHHPSFATLLPILGVTFIIWFGGTKEPVTLLLSSKFFRVFGLISYSTYLWHQPFFALIKIRSVERITNLEKIISMLLIFLLAFLTYKFVEQPFRYKKRISAKQLWISSLGLTLAILFFSIFIISTDGMPNRDKKMLALFAVSSTKEYTKLSKNNKPCRGRSPDKSCRFGDESWVLIGDSHAGVYAPSLYFNLKQRNIGFIDLSFDLCPLSQGLWFEKQATQCGKRNAEILKVIKSFEDQKIMVISSNAAQHKKAKKTSSRELVPFERYSNIHKQLIKQILKLGHKIIFIYPVPLPGFDVPTRLRAKMGASIHEKFLIQASRKLNQTDIDKNKLYDAIPISENIIKIYPDKVFCKKEKTCIYNDDSNIFFSDSNHLTRKGADLVIKEVLNSVKSKWGISTLSRTPNQNHHKRLQKRE